MRWVTLFLICLGFWGSSEIMAQQPVERHLQIQGVDRQYFVFDAHQQKQAPLVLVLHGGGGNGLRMLKRWQSVAQREGLIIVAPNAEKNTWNAVGCCGQGQQQQNADAAFIQQVLKSTQQNYSIDPYHIYIVGFSNGGMLTYQLIAQNRTPFAAAAVVSAAMFAWQPQPQAAMPLLVIHGVQDQVVPIDGGMSQMRFVARTQAQPFLSLNQTLNIWKKTNHCQNKNLISTSNTLSIWQYTVCQADLQVNILKLTGHTWLEAEQANEFDTTQTIWNFLKQHHR